MYNLALCGKKCRERRPLYLFGLHVDKKACKGYTRTVVSCQEEMVLGSASQ